jgi:glycosyltransferase involved in cell wall biosynthesis
MPKTIAVIIPCYNNSQTLDRAIISVLRQTIKIHEIIIINDCSPDTEQIEKIIFNYPEVIYIKNEVNLGIGRSRNIGILSSKSDIISFLDADDELHFQKIELQLSLLTPYNVVSCYTKKLKKNKPIDIIYNKLNYRIITRVVQNVVRNNIVGAGIMIERKLILDIGLYDQTLRSGEDFDLWLRILKKKIKVYVLKIPLYYYYYNDASLTKNYSNISYWETQVLKKNLNIKYKISNTYTEIIIFVWILRQMYRYVKQPSPSLLSLVYSNINLYKWNSVPKFILLIIFRPIKYFSSNTIKSMQ